MGWCLSRGPTHGTGVSRMNNGNGLVVSVVMYGNEAGVCRRSFLTELSLSDLTAAVDFV